MATYTPTSPHKSHCPTPLEIFGEWCGNSSPVSSSCWPLWTKLHRYNVWQNLSFKWLVNHYSLFQVTLSILNSAWLAHAIHTQPFMMIVEDLQYQALRWGICFIWLITLSMKFVHVWEEAKNYWKFEISVVAKRCGLHTWHRGN